MKMQLEHVCLVLAADARARDVTGGDYEITTDIHPDRRIDLIGVSICIRGR
jgi:hypothetical protein